MLGEYAAPLGNQVGDSVGFALGYQHFISGGRRAQIIPEIGGRLATDDDGESSLGVGLRFQRAFGQHSIFQIDGFFAGYDDDDRRPEREDTGFGIRCEWQVKF